MIALPDNPDAVRAVAVRNLLDSIAEALQPVVDAFRRVAQAFIDAVNHIARFVTSWLDGLPPGVRRRFLRRIRHRTPAREWAHYAKHAGTPRSRSRPGRR